MTISIDALKRWMTANDYEITVPDDLGALMTGLENQAKMRGARIVSEQWPILRDRTTDENRLVTQSDVMRLLAVNTAYTRVFVARAEGALTPERFDAVHAALASEVGG